MKNPLEKNPVVDSIHLDINNSGVTFSVQDNGFGPEFVIESGAFGNLRQTSSFNVTKRGLKDIRDMIDRALKCEFSANAHFVAQSLGERESREASEYRGPDDGITPKTIFGSLPQSG